MAIDIKRFFVPLASPTESESSSRLSPLLPALVVQDKVQPSNPSTFEQSQVASPALSQPTSSVGEYSPLTSSPVADHLPASEPCPSIVHFLSAASAQGLVDPSSSSDVDAMDTPSAAVESPCNSPESVETPSIVDDHPSDDDHHPIDIETIESPLVFTDDLQPGLTNAFTRLAQAPVHLLPTNATTAAVKSKSRPSRRNLPQQTLPKLLATPTPQRTGEDQVISSVFIDAEPTISSSALFCPPVDANPAANPAATRRSSRLSARQTVSLAPSSVAVAGGAAHHPKRTRKERHSPQPCTKNTDSDDLVDESIDTLQKTLIDDGADETPHRKKKNPQPLSNNPADQSTKLKNIRPRKKKQLPKESPSTSNVAQIRVEDDEPLADLPAHPFFSKTREELNGLSKSILEKPSSGQPKRNANNKKFKSKTSNPIYLTDDDIDIVVDQDDDDDDDDEIGIIEAIDIDAGLLKLEGARQKLRLEIARSLHEQEVMFKDLPSHPFFAISAPSKKRLPQDQPLSMASSTPHHSECPVLQLIDFPLPQHQSLSHAAPSNVTSTSIPVPSTFPLETPAAAGPHASTALPYYQAGDVADYFKAVLPQPSSLALPSSSLSPTAPTPTALPNGSAWIDLIQAEFCEAGCFLNASDLQAEVTRLARMDEQHHHRALGSLWIDRFRPESAVDWVGSPATASLVHNHLFGTEEEQPHHVLLYGPLGVGKTTLVYVLAEMAGYRIIELNSSDVRSAAVLQNSIEEATQSNSVLAHTFILVEDVDQFFATDKGFITALNTLMAHSKRPIILTSSNPRFQPSAIGLDPTLFETVYVAPNQRVLIALRALTICNQALPKGLPRPPLRKLIELLLFTASWDLRRLIHMLQLACSVSDRPQPLLAWEGFPSTALGFPGELASVPLTQFPPLLQCPRFLASVADACAAEAWPLTFENYLLLLQGETLEAFQEISEIAESLSLVDLLDIAHDMATTPALAAEPIDSPEFDAFGSEPLYHRLAVELQLGLLAQITPNPTSNGISPFRVRITNQKVAKPAQLLAAHCMSLDGFVPDFRKTDLRGIARVDYATCIRDIVEFEEFRCKAQQKRRFFHYLTEFPNVDPFDLVYLKLGGRFSSLPT